MTNLGVAMATVQRPVKKVNDLQCVAVKLRVCRAERQHGSFSTAESSTASRPKWHRCLSAPWRAPEPELGKHIF